MSDYSERVWAVGERVRAQRDRLGLSQVEVAKRATAAGHLMHQTTVAKIEGHQRRAGLDDVFALADVFGIDPGELLYSEARLPLAQAEIVSALQDAHDALGQVEAGLAAARRGAMKL